MTLRNKHPLLPLAPGEHLIWQGSPAWYSIARNVFHVRIVAFYFIALTLIDMMIIRAAEGRGWPVVQAAIPTVLTGCASVVILLTLAWATQRTTTYTLTTRRLVMNFGVALPATLMIPLHRIAATSVRIRRNKMGDISLRLHPGEEVMFAKLWPHVRPWRLRMPEPMLRDLPDAAILAPMLCRALAADAQTRSTTLRTTSNIRRPAVLLHQAR